MGSGYSAPNPKDPRGTVENDGLERALSDAAEVRLRTGECGNGSDGGGVFSFSVRLVVAYPERDEGCGRFFTDATRFPATVMGTRWVGWETTEGAGCVEKYEPDIGFKVCGIRQFSDMGDRGERDEGLPGGPGCTEFDVVLVRADVVETGLLGMIGVKFVAGGMESSSTRTLPPKPAPLRMPLTLSTLGDLLRCLLLVSESYSLLCVDGP